MILILHLQLTSIKTKDPLIKVPPPIYFSTSLIIETQHLSSSHTLVATTIHTLFLLIDTIYCDLLPPSSSTGTQLDILAPQGAFERKLVPQGTFEIVS